MRVALAQTEISWENKDKNEETAREYVIRAVEAGAQSVFFPEMSLTGFSMNIEKTAEEKEITVHRFARIAEQYHIVIGIGWVKRKGKLAENHYTVIDKYGEVLSDYIKIHPFSYAGEDKYFISGNKTVSFQLGGYNWSNFICYDLRFPELFQMVSETAEVILVPANWPKKRENHWKNLLVSRAIESQCYILGVNCVGHIDTLEYSGISCGISPDGEILGEIVEAPGILMIDLNENVKEMRRGFPVKKDRKWDFYISEYGKLRE